MAEGHAKGRHSGLVEGQRIGQQQADRTAAAAKQMIDGSLAREKFKHDVLTRAVYDFVTAVGERGNALKAVLESSGKDIAARRKMMETRHEEELNEEKAKLLGQSPFSLSLSLAPSISISFYIYTYTYVYI